MRLTDFDVQEESGVLQGTTLRDEEAVISMFAHSDPWMLAYCGSSGPWPKDCRARYEHYPIEEADMLSTMESEDSTDTFVYMRWS